MKLLVNAVLKYTVGLVLVCLLMFLPAGTLSFFNGWLLVVLLFLPMLVLGIFLFCKKPKLLEKRLKSKEKKQAQKSVVAVSGILFIFGFIAAGLDFRFGISKIPAWGIAVASVILLISYVAYAEVMRENEYLSRVIEVQNGQKVVDSGLYSVVRHPMYAATVCLFLSIPIVLGSFISLIFFLPYPVLIVIRIINEEKLLEKDLEGYAEYKKKVKFRLLPFIW